LADFSLPFSLFISFFFFPWVNFYELQFFLKKTGSLFSSLLFTVNSNTAVTGIEPGVARQGPFGQTNRKIKTEKRIKQRNSSR
jgi:hypothetical protein